jgi:hypothetical protein
LACRCGPAGAPRGLKDMQSTHLRQQTPHTPRPGPGASSNATRNPTAGRTARDPFAGS